MTSQDSLVLVWFGPHTFTYTALRMCVAVQGSVWCWSTNVTCLCAFSHVRLLSLCVCVWHFDRPVLGKIRRDDAHGMSIDAKQPGNLVSTPVPTDFKKRSLVGDKTNRFTNVKSTGSAARYNGQQFFLASVILPQAAMLSIFHLSASHCSFLESTRKMNHM